MILQRQLNAWSCSLAAVAMVIDEDQRKLIEEIGHDGSEIVLPELPEPARRRGFHFQELIDCAIKRDFTVTPIEVLPYSTPDGTHEFRIDFKIDRRERLIKYMQNTKGVLTGLARQWRHAIAWDGTRYFDPRGQASIDMPDLTIDVYYRFHKIKSIV